MTRTTLLTPGYVSPRKRVPVTHWVLVDFHIGQLDVLHDNQGRPLEQSQIQGPVDPDNLPEGLSIRPVHRVHIILGGFFVDRSLPGNETAAMIESVQLHGTPEQAATLTNRLAEPGLFSQVVLLAAKEMKRVGGSEHPFVNATLGVMNMAVPPLPAPAPAVLPPAEAPSAVLPVEPVPAEAVRAPGE